MLCKNQPNTDLMVGQMVLEGVVGVECLVALCALELVLAVHLLVLHELVLPVESFAARRAVKDFAMLVSTI